MWGYLRHCLQVLSKCVTGSTTLFPNLLQSCYPYISKVFFYYLFMSFFCSRCMLKLNFAIREQQKFVLTGSRLPQPYPGPSEAGRLGRPEPPHFSWENLSLQQEFIVYSRGQLEKQGAGNGTGTGTGTGAGAGPERLRITSLIRAIKWVHRYYRLTIDTID